MSETCILVTGGSSDIGRALIARMRQKPDCPLILAHFFRGGDSIREMERQPGGNGRIVPIQADLREPASVLEMARVIMAEYGTPRQIVHLPAARLRYERFSKMNWERIQEDMQIQVHSIAILLRAFLPELRRSKLSDRKVTEDDARIVFVLSSATLGLPPKYMTAYTIVKYALLGMMRSIAVEYGSEGVRINAVSPSMVETQFLSEIPAKAVEIAAQEHPLGRNVSVDEVCGCIEFLLSRDANSLKCVNIPVTGGLII